MMDTTSPSTKPVLVYDGDCGFCRYTVEYARAVTGDRVTYRPYQEAAEDYADISVAEFRDSIQLIDAGRRHQGADAAFRTLAFGGRTRWLSVYRRLPGFAALGEWLYRWVARHRAGCMIASRLLIGPRLLPLGYTRTTHLMTRAIAACSLAAFLSLWWQVTALYAPDGILPIGHFLDSVSARIGVERYFHLPTLFWLGNGNFALHAICLTGTAAAVCALVGRLPATAAFVQYVCYLSLLHAGQIFLGYQWDTFLLECLVLAALLARAPLAGIWVARLILLRFMFLSGFVKLASGDASWWSGAALTFHFETQPLPNAIAWYAHQLPAGLLTAATWGTLVIELVAPWLIVGPRRVRLVAFWLFIALELTIFLTGNYNFFNLLTMALCLCLLDDDRLRFRRPALRIRSSAGAQVVAALLIALGLLQLVHQVRPLPESIRPVLVPARSLAIANPYGLFAVMTTRRDELVIEGTMDGRTWLPYGFPFKPGDVHDRPHWATPHQPRLDWQMWFAALRGPDRADWIYGLIDALLRANPAVLALVDDPFDGRRPDAVRVIMYHYRFATPVERASDGVWWIRDQRRVWLPPMKLRRPIIRHEPLEL